MSKGTTGNPIKNKVSSHHVTFNQNLRLLRLSFKNKVVKPQYCSSLLMRQRIDTLSWEETTLY